MIAKLVLRVCKFLQYNGHTKVCDNIIGPVPVYSGWEVMNPRPIHRTVRTR
jgi:hypothetical protein